MPFAQIDTGDGPVALTSDTAHTAMDAVEFAADGNDLVLDMNPIYATRRPGAYPLVLTTYQVVLLQGLHAGNLQGDQVVPQRGRKQWPERPFLGWLCSVAR